MRLKAGGDGTTKDAQHIAAFWADPGIHLGQRLAFYGGTGWRASLAFDDAPLLGSESIGVYNGGWLSRVAAELHRSRHLLNGAASLSGAAKTPIRALLKIAQVAMNMAATSGPITKPFRPNIAMPPRVDTSTT